MMNRKTAPKVRDGKVQKKNRHTLTPNYWNTRQQILQIDIEDPGQGYKHFLKKRDVRRFIDILPHWEEIEDELDAIVLARGGGGADGWYQNGVIAICAWEKDMTSSLNIDYFNDHKDLFERLEIAYEMKKDSVLCHFNERQIKAYQLLHILLHEIGHHHDRINTRSKIRPAKGENYAEGYAFKYEKIIWNKYFDTFIGNLSGTVVFLYLPISAYDPSFYESNENYSFINSCIHSFVESGPGRKRRECHRINQGNSTME